MELTITERIRRSGKYLGASKYELMRQIMSFYETRDYDGMKQMFEAHRDWKIKERDGLRTMEEIIQLSKKYFDSIARVADAHIGSGDFMDGSIVRAVKFPKLTSKSITEFCREAIDYNHLI